MSEVDERRTAVVSGILCVYKAGVAQDRERCLAALRRLAHRGADGEGSEIRGDVFLGVRRSSIGRGSRAAQPLTSGDGRLTLGLDGHVHNRAELASTLETCGYRGDLSSDAAIVLGLYSELGDRFFERLHGVWALVLWNEREHELVVSRDRLGVKPLYYYCPGPGQLVIASEIKSILCLHAEARTMNHPAIGDLIRAGRIDDWTRTFFSRIHPVPPATVLRFDGERLTTNAYWTLRVTTDRNLAPGTVLEKLEDAVDRHTPDDVTVGLALSGGIDSATIAGILARCPRGVTRKVHAFSIHPPSTTDESLLIDATIRHTGIPHTYVAVGALDYARSLAQLIDVHDEPIQYSGVFYQFILRQRMAEAGCKAVLVGYGADEIFSGYRFLAPAFLTSLAENGRLKDCLRFVLGSRKFLEPPSVVRIAREILTRLQPSPFRGRDLSVEADRPSVPPVPVDFALRDVDQGRTFLRALLRCFRTNIPLLVRLEDRNAMGHGLDLCVPFMDDALVETALAVPFYLFMEGGRNKAVLRQAAQPVLAPEVGAYRRKLFTPGNDAYVAFEVLRPEFLDLLRSASFSGSGLWSRRCWDLYQADSARKLRGHTWFRVYMVHQWYERIVRAAAS